MTGTEEASAPIEGAAPNFTWRKYHGYHLRRFRFAAVVAAIFVFDVVFSPACEARRMSQKIIQASGSFQSLISTVCWLVGAGFALNGLIKIFRASRRLPEDPLHKSLWRRGILYLFLGIGCISFPFVQAAAVTPPAYIFNGGYMSPRIVEEHGASLKAFSVLCWYFCLAFLLNADVNFRAALRLKGDPAAARLRVKTAIYALMGFAFLAAPAICSFYER